MLCMASVIYQFALKKMETKRALLESVSFEEILLIIHKKITAVLPKVRNKKSGLISGYIQKEILKGIFKEFPKLF